jgi:hypothetical protein
MCLKISKVSNQLQYSSIWPPRKGLSFPHFLHAEFGTVLNIKPLSLQFAWWYFLKNPELSKGIQYEIILSRVGVIINGFWIGWLNLLHLCTQLVTTSATSLSLISTIYNSLLNPIVTSVYYSIH